MRDEFPRYIRTKLAERVGMRCSNPVCPKLTTYGPRLDPAQSVNIGVAAHITAAAQGGPRYDPNLTPTQRRSAENGIWLCQNCGKLIDNDPRRYTAATLSAWKAAAEERARRSVEGSLTGWAGHRLTPRSRRTAVVSIILLVVGLLAAAWVVLFDREGAGDEADSSAAAGAPITILQGRDVSARTSPGTYFKDCPHCPLMVVVPAGRFLMGASAGDELAEEDERPARTVTIRRPFAISVYETTFREWDAGIAAGALAAANDAGRGAAADLGWGRGNRPVINVTFEQAESYGQWLNRQLGQPLYRLPSEAQWEYAARAGASTRYSFGSRYDSNLVSDGPEKTEPVGNYPSNRFKLFDMQGNVWEWTSDCWHDDYRDAPTDEKPWTDGGDCSRHSLRGGSWGKEPNEMRVSNRYPSGGHGYRLGFRVVRELR